MEKNILKRVNRLRKMSLHIITAYRYYHNGKMNKELGK